MQINKSLILLVVGRVLQAILAIATMKLATHYLSPKEMGNYYVLASIATLFGITLISPIGQFVNRKFHSWFDQKILWKRLSTYHYYAILVSFFSLPIIYIAKKYFGLITAINFSEVAFLSAASIYLNTCFNTIVPALNMLERRSSFTLFTTANLAGSLLFSVLFIFIYKTTGTFWYLGQYIAFQVIITFFALLYFKKIINEKISIDLFKINITSAQLNNLKLFSLPLMMATFFMWLLNDSYRFIVEKMLGLETLGNAAVGLSIAASIFALLESLFQQIYYPKFYRKITNTNAEERKLACQELINTAFPLFCFTSLFLACSSPFILSLLASKSYSQSFLFVIFGFGISLARVLTNIISTIAHSELNTNKLIAPYALGGAVAVALLILFLHFYRSPFVIGLVLLLANSFVLVIMRNYMLKIIQTTIPWKNLAHIFLMSLPFFLELIFWQKNNLLSSFVIMSIFGCYYLFVVFKKFAASIP